MAIEASHQPRVRTPSSANGKSDGLNQTSALAAGQRVPRATNITIQVVGVPAQ